ncbi:type IV secretory system conjugative DNA transfer family protein [Enterobacter bugandensis]
MSQHEIDSSKLRRDTRSFEEKVYEWLLDLNNVRLLLIGRVVLQFILVAIWPVSLITSLIFWAILLDRKTRAPMRIPKDVGGYDISEYYTVRSEWKTWIFRGTRERIKYATAGGILYWGVLRTNKKYLMGSEIWSTNSDCRTHVFLAGTTGSGKSESLYGMVYNSLCWGSGAVYADGKADISLPFTIWSLCRRMGRDDDFLHLNLLTAGRDPYLDLLEEEKYRRIGESYFNPQNGARSNSLNPFFSGTADFQVQLMTSLLPKADGNGAQWQEKAVNLVDAIIRCLRYKHLRGDLTSGIHAIQKYLGLEDLLDLYKEGEAGLLPYAAYSPIANYLKTGLSFDFSLIDEPQKWNSEVRTQHGYLTSQFQRTLQMMIESYGFVYNVKHPDIDLSDVLLNNRVLVISIPSLEKSSQEAEALGKLVLSCIRLMMAENLGTKYEGTKAEILQARPTSSPVPSIIITDELAYYYASGLAVMYAQARSLGFMMVAAVQDIQGLKRGSAGEETASLLANTKFKYCLALEDGDDTFSLIQKVSGEGYFSTLSGFDYQSGTVGTWSARKDLRVESRNRISITDVKRLNSGEGYLIFKDSLIEMAAFYIPDNEKHTKLSPRINQFIEIDPPVSLEGYKTEKIIASSELPLATLLLAGITTANTDCSINGAIVDVEYQIEEELRSSYSDDTETFTVSKSLTLEGQKKRLLQAALTAMREAA